MKLLKLLPIFLLFQLISCSAPNYPEFKEMKNVKFKSVGFLNGPSVTFKADAVFFNPNQLGANVTEVDLDVYIDGKKVTHINQDVSAEMKGNSEFILPLDFDIALKDIYKDGKAALGSMFKNKKVLYKMDGTLKVGLGSVEIAVPIDFEDEEEIKI